jgi:hypothetical protein
MTIDQLIDFFEARYNFNETPYITYPNRVTNIISGYGVGESELIFSGVNEAPFTNELYARINGNWQVFTIPDTYSQAQSDARYYPISSNPAGYLTSSSLSSYVQTSTLNNYFTKTESNALYYSVSNPAGYITASSLHDLVTIGTANGLSLFGQQLSLALASGVNAGAMSIADKVKLDSIVLHDPVTLLGSNGLSLNGQELSLALATTSTAGAMSASDKTKLNGLSNYTHPTGFTNQPISPLTGNSVISRIIINSDGHVTGVETRVLDVAAVGVTPQALTRVNDTNVTLTLGGTPATALLQQVSLTLGWTGELSVSRGGTGANTFTAGQILIGNGTDPITTITREGIDTRTSFPAATHTLTSHSDVTLTTPLTNQVLGFNGTTWTNITLDLNNFDYEETDPLFTAFNTTTRGANTFYAAPNGSTGVAGFRTLVTNDIPNVYLRFDITQTLSEAEKSRVRNAIGVVSDSTVYEPAFLKGDVIPNTGTPLTITNGSNRVVGTADLIIAHNASGWVNKTTLTGANVISNLTVDSFGHISNWTTRALTLEDLGFVAFDPTTIEATLNDHESRIDAIEALIPTFPSDKNYVHVQNTAAAIWNVTHNLNKKPSVTIIDSAGSIVLAKLVYVNLNTVTIDFDGSATSGEAIFN